MAALAVASTRADHWGAAILEGEKARRFRKRVLVFCSVDCIWQCVAAVLLISISSYVPVDLQTAAAWCIGLSILNALLLFCSIPILLRRGTGRHHLYTLILMIGIGAASILTNDWYVVKLTLNRNRIISICSALLSSEGAVDIPKTCRWRWAGMTFGVAVYLVLSSSSNVALFLFSYKLILHGHKKHKDMVKAEDPETLFLKQLRAW